MTRETFKKIITSPELIEKINPDNKKLVDRFLKEKSTRCSPATIDGYRSDLNIFMVWNLEYNNNKLFTEMKKLEFSDFFSFVVEELHWNSSRFSRTKSVLSTFSNFIEKFYDDEYKNFRNIVLKSVESLPKNIVREKTIFTEKQVYDLLDTLVENHEYQIACWFSLSISSGSRFSELLRFTIDNIDINHTAFDGIFLETLKPIKTKGRGKQGKLLVKYIVKDIFLKYYNLWIPIREKILLDKGKSHLFLFIKNDGDMAEESTARGWVDKIEKYLKCDYYPHASRHFYTTYLSKNKIPPDLIKELVGWATPQMVDVYVDTKPQDRVWTELSNLTDSLNKNKLTP